MRSLAIFFGCLALLAGTCRIGAKAQDEALTGPVAVGPQYDATHVYVAPRDVGAFARSFLTTFGGKSTPQVLVTVTPTPSKTISQLLQTPVGTVSLFGFLTPIPIPFGTERNGYMVTDMAAALVSARKAGADVIVTPFPDSIGIDAVVQWPGGVKMQLYWHKKTPSYTPFLHIPENRVYVSADRAAAFEEAFLRFSKGKVISNEGHVSGAEIGRAGTTIQRVRIDSVFGKMTIYVTDGHLPYPYGAESTGYEVDDLDATLARAMSSGAEMLVHPNDCGDRRSAMVKFPGGYIAEVHQLVRTR